MNKGFSLAEVIIATFVIIIGIIGAMSLITYSISNVAVGKSQVIAASLAQEGMEIVRNIRDSNWIENRDSGDIAWNDGLGAGSYQVQYDRLDLFSWSDEPLKINNNVYQYGSGTPTHFKRKITITDNPDDDFTTNDIKVVSEVTWNERSRSYEIIAESRLYDWK